TNGTRPLTSRPLKLLYLRFDTISSPRKIVSTAKATDNSSPGWASLPVQTVAASTAAEGGLARPTKNRLSTVSTWVLNRASRIAAQAAKTKAAAQPNLPSGSRPQLNMTRAGANPKLTISDKLSYW